MKDAAVRWLFLWFLFEYGGWANSVDVTGLEDGGIVVLILGPYVSIQLPIQRGTGDFFSVGKGAGARS